MDKDEYKNALEQLAASLKKAADRQIREAKVLPSYDDFLMEASSLPTMRQVYANFDIRGVLRKDCKHETSTIVIESDENGNKSQRTICSICGKLLPKSEINQDSVI